jgi:hypothetical protein
MAIQRVELIALRTAILRRILNSLSLRTCKILRPKACSQAYSLMLAKNEHRYAPSAWVTHLRMFERSSLISFVRSSRLFISCSCIRLRTRAT